MLTKPKKPLLLHSILYKKSYSTPETFERCILTTHNSTYHSARVYNMICMRLLNSN